MHTEYFHSYRTNTWKSFNKIEKIYIQRQTCLVTDSIWLLKKPAGLNIKHIRSIPRTLCLANTHSFNGAITGTTPVFPANWEANFLMIVLVRSMLLWLVCHVLCIREKISEESYS